MSNEQQMRNNITPLPIESGFPMPVQVIKPPTVAEQVYATLKAMEAGQSFVINSNGRQKAREIAKKLKMEICSEEVEPEKYENGYTAARFRVWLINQPPKKEPKKLGRPRKNGAASADQ
jgi:hypothetical protein